MNTKYIFIPLLFLFILSCTNNTTELKLKPEKLYPISINEKWGFIDKTGKAVIEPKYEYAWNFSEGLAAVQVNNKWGFIDRSENMVIKPIYDSAYGFLGGIASVELNEKRFYINRKGNYIRDKDVNTKKKNKK